MNLQYLIQSLKSRFFSKKKNAHDADQTISASLIRYSQKPIEDIYKELKTSINGLDERRAKARLKKYGPNEIAHEKPPTWYFLLLNNFTNPFVVLMMVLGIVSFFLQQYDSVVIISVMVILSVFIRFIQEFKSNNAAQKLSALVSTKATVFRRSGANLETQKYEIKMKDLVPGDIIHLSAGDMVPADIRLITSKELYVSQSILTGESIPVEKEAIVKPLDGETNPLSMLNLCFMGTNVRNGTATAIVLGTNNHSYIGTLSKSITGHRALTSFDIGINKITWLLIKFVFVMVPLVFLINGISKGDRLHSFFAAVAVPSDDSRNVSS